MIFGIPTALHVGGLRDNDNGNLLVDNKLDQQDLFVNDTWSMGRVTFNFGVRWDRYRGWMPDQRQLAFAIGPVNVPEQTFAGHTFYTFNSMGPRAGVTYDSPATERLSLRRAMVCSGITRSCYDG